MHQTYWFPLLKESYKKSYKIIKNRSSLKAASVNLQFHNIFREKFFIHRKFN